MFEFVPLCMREQNYAVMLCIRHRPPPALCRAVLNCTPIGGEEELCRWGRGLRRGSAVTGPGCSYPGGNRTL